jgi:glycosyltransferase involved in cell wall biosynthesis
MRKLRVALVHDWLTGMRGGEQVLLELCRLFPDSGVYTLFWKRGSVDPEIERRVRQTSCLQGLSPFVDYRSCLPLYPAAVRSLRISGADIVISSSHAVAKSVRVPTGVPHLSYIHTPMRMLWGDRDSYFAFGRGRSWKRLALKVVEPYLRRFDLGSVCSVDKFVANSQTVRQRIRDAWSREADVVYPPVDVDYFSPLAKTRGEDFHLIVSALEPHKRIDLAIDAFRQLGRRLVIAGSGTQAASLQSIGAPNIEFAGRVCRERLRGLYRDCRALVVPGVEDFGIAAVEAQACGRPVVCFGEGGCLESVIDGRTGIHFRPRTAEALAAAVERAEAADWQVEEIRRNSERFSRQNFRARMLELVAGLTACA